METPGLIVVSLPNHTNQIDIPVIPKYQIPWFAKLFASVKTHKILTTLEFRLR
jgi:hypothetical protein